MNYFVGYPDFISDLDDFDTNPSGWLLPPDEDLLATAGDEVFLIGWGMTQNSGRLVSHIIIGGLRARASGTEIVAKQSHWLPALPLPEHLASSLPMSGEGMKARSLIQIHSRIGRELHDISQEHLNSTQSSVSVGKRRMRVVKEKTTEQHVETIERKAKSRLGQPDFREALLEAYEGKCAISGCSIDAALSAAHILDHSLSECQEVWNGILLRADIHLLFDRHLLRIFPGNPPIVVLDEAIRDDPDYQRFHLCSIRPPQDFDEIRTNAELQSRWKAANRKFSEFHDPPDSGQGNLM